MANLDTLPETNGLPLKIGLPNRKVVFQPSIFRGYVSFREGIYAKFPFIGSIARNLNGLWDAELHNHRI